MTMRTKVCSVCEETVEELSDVHPRFGGVCFRCARKLDAREIEEATVALLTVVAGIRGRRGRDFVRSLRFGELIDRMECRANDERTGRAPISVVHGLEVTVDEPSREGDMIGVRFPGGTAHGSTRDEALFWAGYWYGRKKLGEAVGLLVQKGGRADVVVEE
jgi:hypothetical protein